MVDRTPEIATLLRQKPAAAEGRMAKSTPPLDALRERMAVLWRASSWRTPEGEGGMKTIPFKPRAPETQTVVAQARRLTAV